MRITPGTFAVFWSRPGWRQAFHADVGAGSPGEAVATFRALYPTDVVRSVRGADGRFASFRVAQ